MDFVLIFRILSNMNNLAGWGGGKGDSATVTVTEIFDKVLKVKSLLLYCFKTVRILGA